MTDKSEPSALARRIASSVEEQIEKSSSSRRRFLNRSAVVGGSLLALGGGTGFALAQEDDGDEDDDMEEMTATFDDVAGTDVDVLNYALTLEHLENAFYRQGLEMFGEDDFMEAESLQSFDEEIRQTVFSEIQRIAEHEAAHVDVLTQAVELVGGEPAQEATYAFGFESVDEFLALGQVFENTGVAAYAGAGTYIESPDFQSAALSIHSVEARHAAIMNLVNGESPFPNAYDPPSSQEEVLEAVSPFIESGDGDDEGGEDETATDTSTDTPTESG